MYDVYFDKVLLPVAPSKIKTEINNSNKTVNLINEGEVNILKDPGLTEISFEILLPNVKYPFAKYSSGFKKASYYLDVFENYQKNKKPFQFIISRTLPGGSVLFYTNMKMSLEGYDIVDDVSEGFDITVNVKMKQYKAYGTKTTDISAYVRKSASTRDGGQNNAGKKYKIVSGDTLWGIAKRFLGKGSRWPEIYNANKSIIESVAKKHGKSSSSNGHWIYPGTEITIPGTSTGSGPGKASKSASSSSTSVDSRSLSSYKGNNGSRTNPPFAIINSTDNVMKSGFKNFDDALNYYMSNGGNEKRWYICDSNKNVIENLIPLNPEGKTNVPVNPYEFGGSMLITSDNFHRYTIIDDMYNSISSHRYYNDALGKFIDNDGYAKKWSIIDPNNRIIEEHHTPMQSLTHVGDMKKSPFCVVESDVTSTLRYNGHKLIGIFRTYPQSLVHVKSKNGFKKGWLIIDREWAAFKPPEE